MSQSVHYLLGIVGWRNTADERTTSQLDLYGPEGRWQGVATRRGVGQAPIDALVEQGAREGSTVIMLVIPPGVDVDLLHDHAAALAVYSRMRLEMDAADAQAPTRTLPASTVRAAWGKGLSDLAHELLTLDRMGAISLTTWPTANAFVSEFIGRCPDCGGPAHPDADDPMKDPDRG